MTEVPKSVLAATYLKVSATHRSNRCQQCGKRLKLHPGAFLTGTMTRFTTCRSCGHVNPTVLEKVAEALEEQGYATLPQGTPVDDLPQCLGCGVTLQITRDFTTVFCSRCGREWRRPDLENGYRTFDPSLAGHIALPVEGSKDAQDLARALEQHGLDFDVPYFVARVELAKETPKQSLWGSFTEGWRQGGSSQGELTQGAQSFVALFEEVAALYTITGEGITVAECEFADVFSEDQSSIDLGFTVVLTRTKQLHRFNDVLHRLRVTFLANHARHHGETAASDTPAELLVSDLGELAALRREGLLSEEQFEAAKSRILGL